MEEDKKKGDKGETSKRNLYEVRFINSFVKYLLCQVIFILVSSFFVFFFSKKNKIKGIST